MTRDEIETAFLAACRSELQALKPGNVHIHAAGHGMQVEDFERSAIAAGPFVADDRLGIGERILGGVEASFAEVGVNTNLGILLLCAPLALAAGRAVSRSRLRCEVANALGELNAADAVAVFSAIRRADPGGLGSSETADVRRPPDVSLMEAMRLAASRDRIARAYVTDFDDVFDFGLPRLAAARCLAANEAAAVTELHMAFLAAFPDSHIARKYGFHIAGTVQKQARDLIQLRDQTTQATEFNHLISFDRSLKDRGYNPGTTADFVVATLFAGRLIDRLAA